MSELMKTITETLNPKKEKENEQQILEKAKEEFKAKGGKIEKIVSTEPAKRKRNSSSNGKNKKAKGKSAGKSNSTGIRKPVLSCFAMLKIKQGTKLTVRISGKINDKVTAIVTDPMNTTMDILYGKKKIKVFGLMHGEKEIRTIMKVPVKKPQGWDVFGIEVKGKWTSIHSIYNGFTKDQLYNNRPF